MTQPIIPPAPKKTSKKTKLPGTTVYTVQQLVNSDTEDGGPLWRDLGLYNAIQNRIAVTNAMKDHDLEEGDFRAIPETSAKVFKPRVRKTTEWQ